VGAEIPTTGNIKLNGQTLQPGNFKQRCQHVRMIFQDSGTTLNPSLTIGQLLNEPLVLNTDLTEEARYSLIRETLQKVGLLADHMNFYPHMFSGGQKQRISLARAIILDPQVIILDEALASLDPSLRSQMINLLLDLQEQMGLAYILISHNLGIVRHFSDKIMVLSHGQVMETGETSDILNKPKHTYTKKLIMSQRFQLSHR
jgi:cationic peptide transport system ATP-binding protein